MKEKIVYIVHGYTSSSDAEWFPWIKRMLNEKGINVSVFDMPSSNDPVVLQWIEHLDNNIEKITKDTYFIAHSLGCIALLRYLEGQPENTEIGGIIFASGFIKKNPKYPNFDQFIKEDLNMTKIIKMTQNRVVFSAPNDPYVPYTFSCELADHFNAILVTIENGGHFIGQEGFYEFPQLFEELCRMMNE